MPNIYEGDKPYIFVSYSHYDEAAVRLIIEALIAEGYRVWYDAGIELAAPWPEYIADRVFGCACFVQLISKASLASDWCMDEVNFALDEHKTILPIYLEPVELPRVLRMRLSRIQALHWYKFDSDSAFYTRLFRAKNLDPCLTEEGCRRRRGVKPRGGQDADSGGLSHEYSGEVIAFDTIGGLPAEAFIIDNSDVDGVRPKAGFADYSWAELKAIADMIAAAGDDDWEGIAKHYNLVGADGKLKGATKEIVLGDKTKAHVRIAGFRHDELVGGGLAGITFEFADVPARHRMNPGRANAGGWEGSEMREWLNGDFLTLLPADLRANLAAARKRTNNKGSVPEGDTACVTATDDRLWLLSMSEVYGKLSGQEENVPWSPATYDAEGTQYQLYRDMGVSTTSYGLVKKRGAYSVWWLRSPIASGSRRFRLVYSDGDWLWDDYADYDWGVSPGFCF